MLGFRCSSIILYSGRIVPGHLLVRGHMELFCYICFWPIHSCIYKDCLINAMYKIWVQRRIKGSIQDGAPCDNS